MNQQEFMTTLRARLSGLPAQDVEERLHFYREMIADRMEEGRTEEEAIADIGSPERIAEQIIADTPLTRIAKERILPQRRLRAWEIVLLALGSPIWLSLAVALLAVILSLYVTLWAVTVSLWAVFASVVACAPAGIALGVGTCIAGQPVGGVAIMGASLVCAGVGIFAFFGCYEATRGCVLLSGLGMRLIKKCFIKKEDAQ
ncbi:MAG: DUF1700 domain-containing protein [Clostridia bacterium]|nr:DUF1700 domain-containing protein [Clostridia bacterium]